MSRFLKISALILIFFTNTAFSQPSACPNAMTTIDMQQCLAKKIKKAESTVEKEIQNSSNEKSKTLLKTLYLEWKNQRDILCKQTVKKFKGGSAYTIELLGCYLQKTESLRQQ